MSQPPLVLLVEDEPLILMDLEMAVEEGGYRTCTASCVQQALALLGDGTEPPAVAILDVSLLEGETSLPVALELERRGIPYIFHSGDFDRHEGPIRSLGAPVVPKPAASHHVVSAALERLATARNG